MKWKNGLIRCLIWALCPKATRLGPKDKRERILIISTTGLGDTLWGTPAIRALRQSFPESYIALLTSKVGSEALKHAKGIDEIFTLSSQGVSAFLSYLRPLRKKRFDSILLFHTSQRFALPFCHLIEGKEIIGTGGMHKGLDFLLTHPIEQKEEHEITRRLAIVKAIGARARDLHLEVSVTREDSEAVKTFLQGHGIPDHIPLVGIHPGAKDKFKQWPEAHFAEVGRRLSQHMGCQIFVSGSREEAPLVFSIASQIPGAIPVAGELGVTSFAALLKQFRLFITNDTGPMHLAFGVNTPTVAIFGPTDPTLCGPLAATQVQVLKVPQTCSPCLKKRCEAPFCLRQLGPDAVYQAAIDLAFNHTLSVS